MLTIFILVSALVWLVIGLSTGSYIEYNNLHIAGWPLIARILVVLLGPTIIIVTILYFIGWFVTMAVASCMKPAWEFIKG